MPRLAVAQSPRRLAIAALLATALALAFGIRSSEGAVKGQARSEAPSASRSLLGATARPRRDRRAPKAPTGLSLIEATETSAALVWTAASDNVGVAGYDIYQDGEPVGTTSGTGHTFTPLTCGSAHTFTIRAWDAAGNRSRQASVVAATAACADRGAPGQPGALVQTATNETTVSIAWSGPGDDDVVGYGIYLGSLLVATTSEPAYALAGLACGTSYTVGVNAQDASGNQSEQTETIVTTSACRDARAPAPPTDLRQTDASETGVTVAWGSSDRRGVTYGVYQNGVRAGETPETVYSLSGLACGATVTVAVDAYDRSGNRSPQVSIAATTAACSEPPPPPGGDGSPPPTAIGETPPPGGDGSPPPTAIGETPPPSAPEGEAPSAPTADGEAPSSPTDLAVGEVSETTVALAWGAADDNVGVVGYGLYAGGEAVGTTAETSYTFAGLTCGTTYALSADAFDDAGNRSEQVSLSVTTADCPEEPPPPSDDGEAPAAPSGLVVKNSTQTSVSFQWSPSTDNVGVVGYGVYRDGSRIGTTAQTDYVVTGLTCGTAYTMAVDAYDAARNRSSASEVVVTTSPCATTDTQPPSVPDNQTISAVTQTSFTMTWSASTDNVGVTGYNVYLNNVRVTTVPGLSYTYTGLTCGTTYTVGLEARDAAGNISSRAHASGSASTTSCNQQPPPTDTQSPTVPTGLTVTGSTQTTVSLSWNPSTDIVGVTGYGIYRAGVRVATESQTSYTLAGLTCGSSVTVGVDAADAAGNRSSVASLIATTGACSDTQPPSTPASLALTSRTQTSISISWAASTDTVGVTGYGVYRNGTRIGTTLVTTSTFTGLTCGTSYTLGVDAADAAGNRSEQATVLMSTTACTTGDTQPPSVPGNQTILNITRTGLTMTWLASTDNVGVTGYNVYLNNVRVTTVPGLTYTFTGLTCSTTYTVGIEARDAAGNVSNRAQATGSATTQSCIDTPPPTGGEVFLSPSGSDSNPCSEAAPCRSLDRGYDLAAPGDEIELACGSYGSQSVNGTKADPGVVFRSASSRCAGVSLDMYAQNAEFRSIDFSGFWLWGARDVTIADSDVGPLVNVVPYVAHSQSGSIVPSRNIVLEGNRFHDITTTGDTHGECLMVQGADGIVIRGNTWSNCNYFNIFITWWGGFAAGHQVPTNGVIENNFFEPATRGGFFSVRFAGYPQRWSNWTVRNNSSTQAMSWGDSGTQHSNFVVTGNVMPMVSYNCPGDISFSYNVVTGSTCGSSDRLVGDLGFISSTDFHLRSGSAAIDAGNPGNFAATDIDGRGRPVGAAPDAGAHEAG